MGVLQSGEHTTSIGSWARFRSLYNFSPSLTFRKHPPRTRRNEWQGWHSGTCAPCVFLASALPGYLPMAKVFREVPSCTPGSLASSQRSLGTTPYPGTLVVGSGSSSLFQDRISSY